MAARQSTEVQESMPMLNGGYPVLVDQQLLVTELAWLLPVWKTWFVGQSSSLNFLKQSTGPPNHNILSADDHFATVSTLLDLKNFSFMPRPISVLLLMDH